MVQHNTDTPDTTNTPDTTSSSIIDDTFSIRPETNLSQPDLYINRELSWIEFNRRVFEEAQNEQQPLLERVKFISIFETNLDEFIMIRLAGIKDQVASSKTLRSPDGRTAEEQLAAIRQALAPLVQQVREYWRETLLPLLAQHSIYVLDYEQLDTRQRHAMRDYFEKEVFPVLTPLAVDAGHPFPHISNLSLNLAVVVVDEQQTELFARLKVPPTLPRLVPIPLAEPKHERQQTPGTQEQQSGQDALNGQTASGEQKAENEQDKQEERQAFVWLEQVIAANLNMLFPGYKVWESYPFRVLRDADIELQEDEASDLLKYIEREVRDRRFGAVVDLAVNPSMPARVRSLLLDNLEITSHDLTVVDGPLGMGSVMELYSLNCPDLKDTPFVPHSPPFLKRGSEMFDEIQKRDILIHHPYDSFNSVLDFINAAADDPQVLAIKQTLYRVGSNAPIVRALLHAVENGKQVAVLVELKARFDEENNIVWARELERAGAHVVYGPLNRKTHGKIALVVRKEDNGLSRYIHLGTGNYNASTARIYEDFGFFTHNENIGSDATELFNSLTGYAHYTKYRKLLVAPEGLRPGLTEHIEREIRLHKEHGNGRLIFKMNALTDPDMIRLLYQASQAGVEIDLIIRGMCCLRPGVKGVSEHIRVRSIVGRFLEHSRIYYFANHGHPDIYLGSADLMERNLNVRVEALFPIESETLQTAIYERVLQPILADTVNARELQSDGSYQLVQPTQKQEPFDSQAWFMTHPLLEDEVGV